MTDPDEVMLRKQFEHQRWVNRQFTFLSLSTAPTFMALALVKFSAIPIVGWVLYVVGTVACAVLIARASAWLGSDDAQVRKLAVTTIALGVMSPVVSILGILFIEP